MKLLLYFSLLFVLLSGCRKEKPTILTPYKERIIYTENFNDTNGWIPMPYGSYYEPGTECFRIEEHMLKLRFEQATPNCGCAWVGAKKQINGLQLPVGKFGMRVTVNKGFFQDLVRFQQVTSYQKTGTSVIKSSFRMTTPNFLMTIPDGTSGWINEDSVMNFEASKLTGTNFELIWNKGERLFYLDGVKQSADRVNIQKYFTGDTGLNFDLYLGHETALSPMLMELYIEKIEVFTWDGEFEH
jgi:hypothetical protein